MNIKTATQILKRHNKWRRGDEKIMPVGSKRLGLAIDTILEKLKNHSDLSNDSGFSAAQMVDAFKDGWIKEGELVDFDVNDYR